MEILFRAWDGKRYSIGNPEYFDDSVNFRFHHFDINCEKPILEQFTGLHAGVFNSLCGDKEYDEIYEGDKISVTYANQGMSNSHEHTITGVVAFKDGSFVVEWDFPKKGKYKHQTLNSVKRLGDYGVVIKIIGNIHDNPAKDEIQP